MRTVVFAARKGGSGKTTLAAHLAVQAEREGAGPVTLIDLDPQQSLAAWWDDREASTPLLSDLALPRLHAELTATREEPGMVFVDTPGFEADPLEKVIRVADLVVIPVQPSPNDLRGVARTVDVVKRAQRRFCFVIMRATPRATLTLQAPLILSRFGPVAESVIYNRVDYAGAMTDGRTVQELDSKGKAAAEIAQLWDYLQHEIDGHGSRG